jgi:hypothetical protein
MIALCRRCHDKAEGGAWTKEELRDLKRRPHPRRPAPEELTWTVRRGIIYRLGKSYVAIKGGDILRFGERRILWQDRTADGRLLFSFDLLGGAGETLIRIRENSLSIDDVRAWDVRLNTRANRLTVQPSRGHVALDLRLRRLTVDDLRPEVIHDRDLSRRELLGRLQKDHPLARGMPLRVSDKPPDIEPFLQYAARECLDEDGRVPVVSFEKADLRGPGNRYLRIDKGGFTFTGQGWFGFNTIAGSVRVAFQL